MDKLMKDSLRILDKGYGNYIRRCLQENTKALKFGEWFETIGKREDIQDVSN